MRSNTIQKIHKQRAVTLVELMIVIALTAIIAGIAIPSYQNLINTNRISSYATNLHSAMLLARTEAITRSRPVVICKSANPNAAAPVCDLTPSANGVNTGWGSGWLIFVDADNNNIFNGLDILIKVQPGFIPTPADGSIVTSTGVEFIAFNMTGQTTAAGNFVINRPASDSVVAHDRAVCVLVGGRARVGAAPNCP